MHSEYYSDSYLSGQNAIFTRMVSPQQFILGKKSCLCYFGNFDLCQTQHLPSFGIFC